MKYRLGFLPEVADDAMRGSRWYEEQAPGLGKEFIRVLYARIDQIVRNPMACAAVTDRYRRGVVRRFPYAIYYLLEGDLILVAGVFHCARSPEVTAADLRDRAGPGQGVQ